MILTAYNFFIPKRDNDIHGTLFATLTLAGNTDFLPNNDKGYKVQLATDGTNIICRSTLKPSSPVHSIPEKIEVKQGSIIQGVVSLTNFKQCAFKKEDLVAFINKNNRKPKYSESHPYKLLNDEEFEAYYVSLFEKNGMKLLKHISLKHSVGSLKISKANKYFPVNDVSFQATITDVELFSNAWLDGIGRTKTYGFGLLRVQVIKE